MKDKGSDKRQKAFLRCGRALQKCAYPGCVREFKPKVHAGRKKRYCSPACRAKDWNRVHLVRV